MKTLLLVLILGILGTSEIFGQEKTAPRTEFTVDLSSSKLEIKPGNNVDVTITLNRSKGYSKSKAVLGLSSGLPDGVTVTFEPSEGVLESSVARISVAETTKPGNYMLILNSTIQYKSKGATLKLTVLDEKGTAVVSAKE